MLYSKKKMCFGSGVLSKKNEMSHFPPPPPSLLHQISWRVEQKRPFSGLFMCLRGVRERERERGRERRKEREQRSQQHNNKAFFPPRQRMFALSGICHRNLSLSLSGGGRRGRAASNRKIFFFRALIWVNDKSFQKAPSEVIHLMQIYEKKNLYRCMTNWMWDVMLLPTYFFPLPLRLLPRQQSAWRDYCHSANIYIFFFREKRGWGQFIGIRYF